MRFMTLCLVLLLTACTRTIYVNQYVSFPEHWLEACEIVPPPVREEYANADLGKRAAMISRVYVNQLEKVAECNVRLKEATDHNATLLLRNKQ